MQHITIEKHPRRLSTFAGRLVTALVMLVITAGATAQSEKTEMAAVVNHPHAGIALAVPKSFTYQKLSEPYDVMRAVSESGGKLVKAVTISAIPVDEKVTAKDFAAAMTEELRSNLTVRHLKVIKKLPLRIAGKQGSACTLTYTHRGEKTSAARVYFLRELDKTGSRICYMLTVESRGSGKNVLSGVIRLLGNVMKTLELTAISRPVDIVVEKFSATHEDHELGFSISVPVGWYVRSLADGTVMAQTDYMAGALSMPQIRVVVGSAAAGATGADQAAACLHKARKALPKADLVAQNDIVIAGLKGKQFILKQKPVEAASKPAQEQAPGLTLIQSVVCVPVDGGGVKTFSLVLICQGGDTKLLRATMDKVSGSFALLEKPTTKPAATPATKPADAGAR